MPSGGFKLLDTAEVKMAFGGYSMFLGNNTLATTNGGGGYSASNNSWLSRTFSGKDNGPCQALRVNEARQTDRSSFNTNYVCAVALCTPTQVVPSAPTSSSPLNNNNNEGSSSSAKNQKQPEAEQAPPKFDPEIIAAARTHRMNRDQCAIGEVYSLNPPQNQPSNNVTPCARVRDVETVVLRTPAVAVVGLFNNIATLFGLVDPACAHPKSSSEFQNGISDSEKFVSLQSIRFAARCTAFTTFTTHVDFAVAHGLAPRPTRDFNEGEENSNNYNKNNEGPFQPFCELWSVFGFGSGDIIIWSHAQEAMLKRHNDSGILTKNNNGDPTSPTSGRIPNTNYVEPGVAVSAIARVDRGLTERPTCMKWSSSTSTSINTQVTCFCDLVVGYENGTILVISLNATGGSVNQNLSGWFGFSAIRSIRACPIAPYLLGVGFDDGSLKFFAFPWSFDAGGFEKELSKGLSTYNNNNAKGANNTSSLSSSSMNNNNNSNPNDCVIQDLNATDIGTSKDPRVLCSVIGAVSGGSVTCVSWEANGEAVVCTGDDDAVSIVSIQISPSLRSLRGGASNEKSTNGNGTSPGVSPLASVTAEQQQQNFGLLPSTASLLFNNGNNNNNASTSIGRSSLASNNQLSTSSSLGVVRQQQQQNQQANSSPTTQGGNSNNNVTLPFSLVKPLDIRPTGVHRRNFHRSWICGSMILSLDVHNINPRTEQPELRTVTGVYTAALDGAVIAGAAFPAQQILSSKNNNNNNNNSSSSNGLAIRHRPLARFVQMARNDTILNFASIGDYNPERCACSWLSNNSRNASQTPGSEEQQQQVNKQRKRSFVTITAKGTVAMWIFYDITVESEVVKEK